MVRSQFAHAAAGPRLWPSSSASLPCAACADAPPLCVCVLRVASWVGVRACARERCVRRLVIRSGGGAGVRVSRCAAVSLSSCCCCENRSSCREYRDEVNFGGAQVDSKWTRKVAAKSRQHSACSVVCSTKRTTRTGQGREDDENTGDSTAGPPDLLHRALDEVKTEPAAEASRIVD